MDAVPMTKIMKKTKDSEEQHIKFKDSTNAQLRAVRNHMDHREA